MPEKTDQEQPHLEEDAPGFPQRQEDANDARQDDENECQHHIKPAVTFGV
jgi:hypothetical protein